MFHNIPYVYEVYKEKSFSKAAKNLYISQPSLSAAIKNIEQKIGAPIFDRSTSPLRLTEIGKLYMETAMKIMDQEEAFLEEMQNNNTLQKGTLSVGANHITASFVLPDIIQKYSALYPNIHISVVEAGASQLKSYLKEDKLDLVIDNIENEDISFFSEYFGTETLFLAVAKSKVNSTILESHCLSVRDIIAGKDKESVVPALPPFYIAQFPFILLCKGNNTRSYTDYFFQESNVHPQILMEVNQMATAYHIVASQVGATVVSDTLIKSDFVRDEVLFFKLPCKKTERNINILIRKNRYMTRATKKILEIIRESREVLF